MRSMMPASVRLNLQLPRPQLAYPTAGSGYCSFTELRPVHAAPSHGRFGSNGSSVQPFTGRSAPYAKPMPNEVSDSDILQFAAPIFFASEDDGIAEIDIMRLGSTKGRVCATYTTEDGSALEGIKYRKNTGKVVFEDGEHNKTISVKLIDDDRWNPTLEFKIHLVDPESCELGTNLHTARVKIIDDDCFPSNKYKRWIGPGLNVDDGLAQISSRGLFWSYMLWNYAAPGIRWRSLLYIGMDQLHNAYLYFKMWTTIFIVDTLFNDKVPESSLFMSSRVATSWALAFGYIVPMFFLHLWDNWKTKIDIGGTTATLLQQSLFRKYLNYSEDSRLAVNSSDVHFAIMEDTQTAAKGYVTILDMVRIVTKFLILMYFVLKENPGSLVYVVLMPSIMLFFACFCQGGLSEVEEEVGNGEAGIITLVQEVCAKYRLIADYAQRPKMNEFFENKSRRLREAKVRKTSVVNNLNFIPVWIGSIFTGMYIALNSKDVGQTINPGVFVATVTIIGGVADDFTDLYSKLTSMKVTIDSLYHLTRLFNLSTDLELWKSAISKRRAKTLQMRQEIFNGTSSILPNSDKSPDFKTDLIQLEVKNMGYEYPDTDEGFVLRHVTVSVQQGNLVAVVGPHGSGKSTLLKLLGHCVFPTEGSIFMPTHLRILHVAQEPILLEVSALHNLTFGAGNFRDTSPQRIRRILQKLEMKFLEPLVERDLQSWEQCLAEEDSPILAANIREDARLSCTSCSPLVAAATSENCLDGADEDETEDATSNSTSYRTSANSGFDNPVQATADEVDSRAPWFSKLTHTEMVKVHLARALIMNPEVIVCHRPFSHFATEKAKIFLSALKEHVENRGLICPEQSRHRRRPRTAFYVPENIAQATVADVIWQLDTRKGQASGAEVYEIGHNMLTQDFHPANGT